ncbi:hypothetical protein PM082_019395 [Marasmius tenuissimus]|nr:hypothetical protein PM082_019395 [Marasmius tenuissimus]
MSRKCMELSKSSPHISSGKNSTLQGQDEVREAVDHGDNGGEDEFRIIEEDWIEV